MDEPVPEPLWPHTLGAVVQGLLLGAGMGLGWLWVASMLGQGLVFRYQGF